MTVRARLLVYPSGSPPGTFRANPPELRPITIERHLGDRRSVTEVPVSGSLSLREVAAYFAVDHATVWRWVRAGKLKAQLRRGRFTVPVREVWGFERRERGPWLVG